MRKQAAAIFLFILSLAPASPGFCLQIQLQDKTVVTDNTVLLGDVATISPEGDEAVQWAQHEVSRSPAPGEEKVIQSSSLIASLRNTEGAERLSWSGPETITVKRQGIPFDKKALEQIIAEFLQQNLDKLPHAELRFTSQWVPENIVLPVGDIKYSVTPSKPGILGSSSFSILFKIDDKTVKTCTIRGKLEAMAEVATAAVTIRKGSLITKDQVELIRQDISKLNSPYTAIESVIGLQAKRTIRVGRAIETRVVEPPAVIRKGEVVKIVASRGPLQISANGIAVMDGRPGEFIRVKNLSSSKLVYCQVDSPGIVSVEF